MGDIAEISDTVKQRVDAERALYEVKQPAGEAVSDGMAPEEVFRYYERNEDGDAELYIRLHRDRLCYDNASNEWHVFDGHHWRVDHLNEALQGIQAAVDVYAHEAKQQAWKRLQAEQTGRKKAASLHKDKETKLLNRIRFLQALTRKENVLVLARTGKDSLGITGMEWDRNPFILGCLNGVIDLQTGDFRPGRPDDYIKTIAPVNWQGLNTPSPAWDAFLWSIFEDEEIIGYIRRLMGYCATGSTRVHFLPILWGKGRNGKGTLLETIKAVLGDQVMKGRAEIFLDHKYGPGRGSPDADTLSLRGKRLVFASETSEGRRLDTARLKEMTGGDTLNARAPHARRPVEFTPTHKLLLMTNDRPSAPASDYALWARIHLIPFRFSFVEDPQEDNERLVDLELPEKLKQEAPGILAWIVRGCLEWQRDGLNPPQTVRQATEEYRANEDILSPFIEECCTLGPHESIRAGVLYTSFKTWCEQNGATPLNGTRFGKEMLKKFDSTKSRGRIYIGISLNE